jgi:hypothetical protein
VVGAVACGEDSGIGVRGSIFGGAQGRAGGWATACRGRRAA